jgi:2-iminobutanoate/2-iminopropanoate deaminase
MSKKEVVTPNAPGAIGPYSQAIRAGDLVFCSGQIPLNPKTGELVTGTIAAETHQVMKNLSAVIEAAGGQINQVVKTTIFLKDMSSFAEVNEAYGSYFSKPYPARATVEVSRLPKDVRVEIEAIVKVSP